MAGLGTAVLRSTGAVAALVAATVALGRSEPPPAPGTAAERGGSGGVRLHELARFAGPTFVGAPRGAGGLAYVVERAGRIKLLDGERKRRGTFLDIRDLVDCCEVEKGLLSVAFAPDYERSRRFYVYFTNKQANIEIDEFKRSRRRASRADRSSRRKLLEIRQTGPYNHNGGQLAFGPDGLLYAATGDGGNVDEPSVLPQRKGSLLGKLLRIDPTGGERRPYGIPRSNPYVGERGANEVYARGLRNPWRFSFHRKLILIGDVGQARREEVDIERLRGARGANFGWPLYEGTLRFRPGRISRHTKPAHQYPHAGGACSITGGYVVGDRRLPGLLGRYIYGDYCTGEIRSLVPRPGGARRDRPLLDAGSGIVSFGVDDRGRVYVANVETGMVSRLDPRR